MCRYLQCVDVPIEMAALFNEVIGETGYFLQMKLSFVNAADDGSATRSTQVDSEEIFFLIHISKGDCKQFVIRDCKGTKILRGLPLLFDF